MRMSLLKSISPIQCSWWANWVLSVLSCEVDSNVALLATQKASSSLDHTSSPSGFLHMLHPDPPLPLAPSWFLGYLFVVKESTYQYVEGGVCQPIEIYALMVGDRSSSVHMVTFA